MRTDRSRSDLAQGLTGSSAAGGRRTAFGASARGWVRLSFTIGETRLAEACARISAFTRSLTASAA